MVVGALPPPPPSKKVAAAARKAAYAPLVSQAGIDPTITVVEKKVVVQDESEGRPNKATYDAEQNSLRAQIDALQVKVNEVKTKIAAVSGKGPNSERKIVLRAELDSLRGEQAKIKGGRGKTLDQVKVYQEVLAKKIKDLQAAKSKAPFKSVGEVDTQIKNIERQVEAGTMKLVDEKKALQEISTLKKTRKTVEGFAAIQAGIDEDKAKVDAMRSGLDDPEAKAISDRFNAAKSELDAINKAHDEASKGRDAIFEERNVLTNELNALFTKKKNSAQAFREANDKFYSKMTEDRNRRAERQRVERAAIDDEKRAEINERLLEEAQAPAFEREIEDCRTLINYFQKRIGIASTAGPYERLGGNSSASLPQLGEARQVELGAPAGSIALPKKGEGMEDFHSGNGGKKGRKGKKPEGESTAAVASQALNLPFGTLSALLTLGITSPITTTEVPTTIEALEAKKAYFVANQARVTKEKIAQVEKKIAIADAKSKANGTSTPAETESTETVAVESTPVVEEKKEEVAAVAVEEEKKEE